jgi:hypothetical protein
MSRETRIVLLVLGLFLLVNGLTLSRYPSVWVDEVQFADPAVSFANGDGFTSTAWFAQDSAAFWAGNVPLYSALLAAWLSGFGTSVVAERTLNLVLFSIFLILVWQWMRATSVVKSSRWRIAAVLLLVCGHSMVFSYRSGRYDVAGMLLAILALRCWDRRWLGLSSIGFLLPFAGLQLVPAAGIVCMLAIIDQGLPALRRTAALLAGTGVGSFALWTFYQWFGVWNGFRASTAAIGLMGQSMLSKLAALPTTYLTDKSRLFVVLALLVGLGIERAISGRTGLTQTEMNLSGAPRRIAGFSLALFLLLPAALHLAGKFPIYYGWMVFVPLAIATIHVAERVPQARIAMAGLLILAGLVGLPLRLVAVAGGFVERDPKRLQEFVDSAIRSDSLVLADFKAYFALREKGVRPLLPTYLPALRPEESGAVTIMIVRPSDVAPAQARLGGEWQPTGAVFPATAAPRLLKRLVAELREEDYLLVVYRRIPVPRT